MKPTIQYADFEKLDVRTGVVVAATAPEWSNKLLELIVDFGDEIGRRTILSGVKQWYSPNDFLNNTYMFVVNLAERKMGEGISQGMMLMADGSDRPIPLPVSNDVKPGTIVR